eukprot:scaffold10096_cov231-Isochrysis_galbana.AAC.5
MKTSGIYNVMPPRAQALPRSLGFRLVALLCALCCPLDERGYGPIQILIRPDSQNQTSVTSQGIMGRDHPSPAGSASELLVKTPLGALELIAPGLRFGSLACSKGVLRNLLAACGQRCADVLCENLDRGEVPRLQFGPARDRCCTRKRLVGYFERSGIYELP